jgi:hypothetical protein
LGFSGVREKLPKSMEREKFENFRKIMKLRRRSLNFEPAL